MTYPRYNNGHFDSGKSVNPGARCPKCNSANFTETVSRELCRDCGLCCDYWGGGANQVYNDYLEEKYAREKAEDERRYQEEMEEDRRYYD